MKNGNKGLNIAIVSLAAACVIAIIIFFGINAGNSGYENVAKKYDKAVSEGKYEDAYEYLDVKDSVFLTKSEYLARQSVVADAFNSLDVKGLIKTVGKKGLGILVNSLFNMQYEVVESKEDDGKAVVAFLKKPKQDTYGILTDTATVKLTKNSSNHMLFFSDWRVSNEDVIVKNITLEIPKYKMAYIDGVAIPESYLDSSTDDTNTYVIPGLYTGAHVCSLSNDGETYKNYNVTTDKSNSRVVVKEVEVSKEEQQVVIDKAYNAFRTITEAELKGSDFNEIKGIFLPESVLSEREKFNEDKNNFYTTNKSSGIDNVEVKDVIASIYDMAFVDGTIEVSVKLEYTDSNQGVIDPYIAYFVKKDRGEDTNNNMTQLVCMRYVDGDWVVSSSGDSGVAGNNWFF